MHAFKMCVVGVDDYSFQAMTACDVSKVLVRLS